LTLLHEVLLIEFQAIFFSENIFDFDSSLVAKEEFDLSELLNTFILVEKAKGREVRLLESSFFFARIWHARQLICKLIVLFWGGSVESP